MSRAKERIKIRRRKRNKIKATMAILSLTLVVGYTQVLGTHAIFNDSELIETNLNMSLGDLDTEVSEGFTSDFKISKENKSISKEFTIQNNGTLKQSLDIQLQLTGNVDIDNRDIFKKISYKLESMDNRFETIETSMDNLLNVEEKIVKPNNKGDLILESGDSLSCKATITIEDEETLKALSEKDINFVLSVRGQQVNLSENGFYDIYTQENIFHVDKEKELEEDETEVVFDYCPCGVCININNGDRAKSFKIDISKFLVDDKLIDQAIDKQVNINGGPIKEVYYIHLAEDGYLYIGSDFGTNPNIDNILNTKLQIQLNFNKKGPLVFMVTFERNGENSFIAKWEEITTLSEGDKSEEIVDTNNQQMDEQLKHEEIIDVNQSEVIEPTKQEEESIDSNVVDPIKPEVEESSKEEVGKSIKAEIVVEPSKEDDEESSKIN